MLMFRMISRFFTIKPQHQRRHHLWSKNQWGHSENSPNGQKGKVQLAFGRRAMPRWVPERVQTYLSSMRSLSSEISSQSVHPILGQATRTIWSRQSVPSHTRSGTERSHERQSERTSIWILTVPTSRHMPGPRWPRNPFPWRNQAGCCEKQPWYYARGANPGFMVSLPLCIAFGIGST